MARNFPDPISITVPLRTTWEERWELMDEHGDPLDLTDYQFRMQVRDKVSRALLLEIGTEADYAVIDLPTGAIDPARAEAFVRAYEAVRPFTAAERRLFPAMLRSGALRFWISRLWDFHLPREAAMLTPHDPCHFERVLRGRLRQLAPAAVAHAAA